MTVQSTESLNASARDLLLLQRGFGRIIAYKSELGGFWVAECEDCLWCATTEYSLRSDAKNDISGAVFIW